MAIPNADRAIIAVEKLTAYLLNPSHKRGSVKARLLISLGYRTSTPEILESDLRQHLSFNPRVVRESVRDVSFLSASVFGYDRFRTSARETLQGLAAWRTRVTR